MEGVQKNLFKIFASWIDQERPIVGNPVIIVNCFFFSILKIVSFIIKNYFTSIDIHITNMIYNFEKSRESLRN